MNLTIETVKKLIREQFPIWQELEIQPVAKSGHDNRTFHLGEELSIRLPSGAAYAGHVQKENIWLPKLQSQLSMKISAPVAMGTATDDYPFPWSVNAWIVGETVSLKTVTDFNRLAKDIARFLKELQAIDSTGGPLAGEQNFYRGGDLAVYHEETLRALENLEKVFPTEKLKEIWNRALASHWDSSSIWVHGDVEVGNLLVREGKLVAVIDFGILSIGDPASDYVMAWTFFEKEGRKAFKEALSCDEETWQRSQGWALWKALISYQKEKTKSEQSLWAKRTIKELLFDYDD